MNKSAICTENRIFAVIVIICLGMLCILVDGISGFNRMIDAVLGDDESIEDYSYRIKNISDGVNENIPVRNELIDMSGLFLKATGIRDYYEDEYGISFTEDGYIVSYKDYASTDYEIEQMVLLKEYLDEKGIRLLYVNEPAKYIDDSVYLEQFGKESYLNSNMDRFLQKLDENNIEYIDLRDEIRKDNLYSFDMFYRTDHHWTVPASRWAASKIMERLNTDYGYNAKMSLFDESSFLYTNFDKCWLGEQGRLLAETYTGLDDFTLVKPIFPTCFKRDYFGTVVQGDFDIFIDYKCYQDSFDAKGKVIPAKMNGWHYSYDDSGRIQNCNAEYGNVLVLGDSYCRTLVPFLSLGIRNIYEIQPRYMVEGQVIDEIEAGGYDTVIVAYAQFMLGAHDDEKILIIDSFPFLAEGIRMGALPEKWS
ncbi:MAG: hypothetical protein J5802_14795 [Butyrivibrio sp.]|nr:hypothetical protein [Butyrivibrio sp.]